MQNKKRSRYVDVVQDRGCLAVIFLPTGFKLAAIAVSDQASVAQTAKLVNGIENLYENYMREVYMLP